MINILLLPGDGIGPEIINEAKKILDFLIKNKIANINYELSLIGGDAYDKTGYPLPEDTLNQAKKSDAVLLGAVGGKKWENIARDKRPEKGLLAIRKELNLFANLRPAFVYPSLVNASSLKPHLVSGLDLMIVRELTGDIYFGKPRKIYIENNQKVGINTAVYSQEEIKRISHIAFQIAQKRNKKLCSVDKANVLEVSELWRDEVTEIAKEYPDVELSHMYIDNAAMQLIKKPKQFDVILTGNMFGDILSDCAAQITGSIGMLASASMNTDKFGLYEPIHGSAPDIVGKKLANPLATILSLAMIFKYSLNSIKIANNIEKAVSNVLEKGFRTLDIALEKEKIISTSQMGDKVLKEFINLLEK